MTPTDRQRAFEDALEQRILVLDGTMGTLIQRRQLVAADFGGPALEGCNENADTPAYARPTQSIPPSIHQPAPPFPARIALLRRPVHKKLIESPEFRKLFGMEGPA
jgi:hypothetical protein